MAVAVCGVARAEPQALVLRDAERSRDVPVHLYEPGGCRVEKPCAVVLLSPGYRVPATAYAFLAEPLREAGFLVVAVQHELPGDAPMPNTGNLQRDRTPAWERGASNLRFVRQALTLRLPAYDWRRVVLVGHSNGGDVSSLLATRDAAFASALVTLDHRRVRLPSNGPRILTLRGSDFEADPGVLPATPAAAACVLRLPNARHDDMQDDGPAELKARLAAATLAFLTQGRCGGPG